MLLVPGVIAWYGCRNRDRLLGNICLPLFLLGYSGLYLVFCQFKSCVFAAPSRWSPEQFAYHVVLIVIMAMWLILGRRGNPFLPKNEQKETAGRWLVIVLGLLWLVALMAIVSVNAHDGLGGANERF